MRPHAPLAAILGLSLALGAWGVRYGLPNVYAWPPDEIIPAQVLEGMAQRFSNGWSDRYPPLHFYLMAGVAAPVLLASAEPVLVSAESRTYERLFLADRLLSQAMGAGILVLLYLVGLELGDRVLGLGAALATAMGITFAYYAKFANLDVPYCFWFCLALLFFLRLLRTAGPRDALGCAAAATLAVCTKDQAFALFVLPSLAVLAVVRRARAREGRPAGWAALARDPRLARPVLLSLVLFASIHNLAFNRSGFLAHLRTVTGPLVEGYRMFDPTPEGEWRLLLLTGRLIVFALGEPATVLCLLGLALPLARPGHDPRLLATLLFPLSYHLFLSAVVLYAYDRFVLPHVLVLSLFAGLALSALTRTGRVGRIAAAACAAAVLAFGLLRVVGLDLALVNDSRYAAEAWLRREPAPGARIAALGPLEYLPRLHGLDWKQRTELARSVERMAPDYVVTNADYARDLADPRARALYSKLDSGELGYEVALAQRTPILWPFRIDEYLRARGDRLPSNLDKINPEIRVYRRSRPSPGR